MALTATTTLGETSLTPQATFVDGCTLASWYTDPLKIKTGPDGSLMEYHNHVGSGMSNQTFTIREIISYDYGGTNYWCREVYNGNTAFCGYKKNDGTKWINNSSEPSCTYGQIKVTSGTVTVTRETSATASISVSATLNYQITQAPKESYYNWQVYVYFQKINSGGELIQYIKNRAKTWSTGTGSVTFSYTCDETSGNTSISSGNYGIWGNGNGVTYNQNPSTGVSKAFSINVPKYNPYTCPVKKYNGSSWVEAAITNKDGTVLPVYKYNGSSWVEL